jgi:hypothetical protein
LTSKNEGSNHGSNTNVREEDQGQLVLLEEHAVLAEVEVSDLQTLGTVVFLSGQIEEQVAWPSEKLVDKIVPEGSNGGVLSQLCELDHVGLGLLTKVRLDPRLPGVGHESSVLLDITRGLVVLRVGETPRVEGNQQEGVHDQAHCIVQLLGFREGTVATFVSQNPDTGEDEPLDRGVGHPGGETEVNIGDHRDEGDGEVDEYREVEVVTDYVCH